MAESAPAAASGRPRAARIPQEELRERLLAEAERMLDGRGLGVNAHPLNMEDLIRQVGVPRSSAFHAFGSKENLFFQLALRLLSPSSPLAMRFAALLTESADAVVAEHETLMTDAAGRRALLRESVRRALPRMHETLVRAPRWRTFRALSMSLDSFPEAERDELRARLGTIQDIYVDTMSRAYEATFERFGVRMRPGLSITHFVTAASSTLEGVATGPAFGQPLAAEWVALPGIGGAEVQWHLSAVALMALVDGMTEAV
ncbi:hypothetical protein [Microbacterium aurantiacum]|uniref:hypothetical protein n=1 Tax=Microbacterium aurantiacum TaxID=162393 RepID=UPI003F493D16